MNILLEQGWSEIDSKLVKNYVLSGFKQAVHFINLIAEDAEKADHHPDIKLYKYKNVRVILTTHSKRRITEKDISLAKKVDQIFDSLNQN
ncbi:4a-hydroxytetrahydrobiopterin dehydratase [Marinifilum caeruleilacunae]|uniref:4a-hydroxytetrahydrobiopterin dehydratase n=1 Tax=Marinifilum caeruleilacunae TaxID=2499076 RepID=A0ABX1WWY4_9BACT|nr:4a-hydroxytetrahydrobiopterin dehydratase [Marinifilum caeruleilacunae]NOU60626.1 4a-hydroxytetrahydrobiopterin dehydratase [Marinifilum caeruleilacunae]